MQAAISQRGFRGGMPRVQTRGREQREQQAESARKDPAGTI